MTRSRRRVGTKTAVRDPGVVPVCGVDVDAADDPVRRRGGVVVEAGPGNRACRILIDVLGDKDPAPSGRRPRVRGVGLGPLDRGDRAAGPRAPRGVRQRRRTEAGPIAAGSGEGTEPLVADSLRLGVRPRAETGGLGAIRGQTRAGEHRLTDNRIADHRRIELARRVRGTEERIARPDPLADVALVEVHVHRWTGEGVEAEVGDRDVEARLAAIADHLVLPLDRTAVGFPGAVVLRAPLEAVHVLRTDGEALELERREPGVEA